MKDNYSWLDDEFEEIDKKYVPEKISSGVELYSGEVDAPSFRQGFNTAKAMLLEELKQTIISQIEIEKLRAIEDFIKWHNNKVTNPTITFEQFNEYVNLTEKLKELEGK